VTTLAAGTKLGRYEIRSKIGAGGIGEVYLAEDTQLHRKVALKILPAEVSANSDQMRRFKQEAISFASAKLQRLTTTGKATRVAISPDGKYVVHVQDDGGQQSLWTRQVATQSNVEIVAPAAVAYDSLTFSPDGDYIYYGVSSQDIPQSELFQVPTLGGAPKKVLVNLESSNTISFSPDGKQFAFVRSESGKEFALMIANADGMGERKLVNSLFANVARGLALGLDSRKHEILSVVKHSKSRY